MLIFILCIYFVVKVSVINIIVDIVRVIIVM